MIFFFFFFNDGINNPELFPSGYNVYRRDRNGVLSEKNDDGGVMISVQEHLASSSIPDWSTAGIIEDLWVSVTLSDGKKLYICFVYISPHEILNNFILFFQKLEEILSNHESSNFMIVGDFYLSNIMWEFDLKLASYRPRYVTDTPSQYSINHMCLLNLKQYCNILNFNHEVFDLIMSYSSNVAVKRCSTPSVKEGNRYEHPHF
ncbi:hypothetical protein JTB14_008872 [Gonioctena quinquepunctata]|nr:hypothetical protein JTB14_008872 [Gonioctena quinquepunctata]